MMRPHVLLNRPFQPLPAPDGRRMTIGDIDRDLERERERGGVLGARERTGGDLDLLLLEKERDDDVERERERGGVLGARERTGGDLDLLLLEKERDDDVERERERERERLSYDADLDLLLACFPLVRDLSDVGERERDLE